MTYPFVLDLVRRPARPAKWIFAQSILDRWLVDVYACALTTRPGTNPLRERTSATRRSWGLCAWICSKLGANVLAVVMGFERATEAEKATYDRILAEQAAAP
jgi:hypothetical protein